MPSSRYSRTIESMTMTETGYSDGVHTLAIGNYFPIRYPTENPGLSSLESSDDSSFTKIFIATNNYTQGDYYSIFGQTLSVMNRKVKILANDYVKANIDMKLGTIRLLNLSRLESIPIDMLNYRYWKNRRISYDVNNREILFDEVIKVKEDCDVAINVNASALIHTLGRLEMRLFVKEISDDEPVGTGFRSTNYPIQVKPVEGEPGYKGIPYTINTGYVIDNARNGDSYHIIVDIVNIVDHDKNPDSETILYTTASDDIELYDDFVLYGMTEMIINGQNLEKTGYKYYIDDELELPVYYKKINNGTEISLEFIEDDLIKSVRLTTEPGYDFVIPDKIEDLPVTTLADGFLTNTINYLNSITIGANVKHIGNFFAANPRMLFVTSEARESFPLTIYLENDDVENVHIGAYVFAWRPILNLTKFPEAWNITEYPKAFNTYAEFEYSTSMYHPRSNSLVHTTNSVYRGNRGIYGDQVNSNSNADFLARTLEIPENVVDITSENTIGGGISIITPSDKYAFGKNIRNLKLKGYTIIKPTEDGADPRDMRLCIPKTARWISVTHHGGPSDLGVIHAKTMTTLCSIKDHYGSNAATLPIPYSEFGTLYLSSFKLGNLNPKYLKSQISSVSSLNPMFELSEGMLTFEPIERNDLDDPSQDVYRVVDLFGMKWIQCGQSEPDSTFNHHLINCMMPYCALISTGSVDEYEDDQNWYYGGYWSNGTPQFLMADNRKYRLNTIRIPHNTVLNFSTIVAYDIEFEDETGDIRPGFDEGAERLNDHSHVPTSQYNPTKDMIRHSDVASTSLYGRIPCTACNSTIPRALVLMKYMIALETGSASYHTNEADDTPLSERVYLSEMIKQNSARAINNTAADLVCSAMPTSHILTLKNPGETGIKWYNGSLIPAHVKVYPLTLKSYADSDGLVFDDPARTYNPVPLNQAITTADLESSEAYGWRFTENQMPSVSGLMSESSTNNIPANGQYTPYLDYMASRCIYLPELLTENPKLSMGKVFGRGAMFHVYAVSRRFTQNFIHQPGQTTSSSSTKKTNYWKNCQIVTFGQGTERIETYTINVGVIGYIQIPPSCKFIGDSAFYGHLPTMTGTEYSMYLMAPSGCTVSSSFGKYFNNSTYGMNTSRMSAMTCYKYDESNDMEYAYTYTKDADTMTAAITSMDANYYKRIGGGAGYSKYASKYGIGTFLMPKTTSDGYEITAIQNSTLSSFIKGLDGTSPYYLRISEVLLHPDMAITEIPDYFCFQCYYLCKTVIPETVTKIGNYAYTQCCHMHNMDIAAQNITWVGTRAFYKCGFTLLSVDPETSYTETQDFLVHSGTSTWIDCSNAVLNYGDRRHLKNPSPPFRGAHSFRIHDGITYIGSGAFACSNVIQGAIKIPENDEYTEILPYTFFNCNGITEITMGSNITTIGTANFHHMNSLKKITIPETVTSYDGALYCCPDLVEANILCPPPTTVAYQQCYFAFCTSLRKVNIPQFTTIYSGMFAGCTSLFEIHLPAATTVEIYAFRNSMIHTIHIYHDCTFKMGSLYGAPHLCEIVCHDGAKAIFMSCAFMNANNTTYSIPPLVMKKMDPADYELAYYLPKEPNQGTCTYNQANVFNTNEIPWIDGDFINKHIATYVDDPKTVPETADAYFSPRCMFKNTCSIFEPIFKQHDTGIHAFPEELVAVEEFATSLFGHADYSWALKYEWSNTNSMSLGHGDYLTTYNRDATTMHIPKLLEKQFEESGFTDINVTAFDDSVSTAAISIPVRFNMHGVLSESIVNELCSKATGILQGAFANHGNYFTNGELIEILDKNGNDIHIKHLVIDSTSHTTRTSAPSSYSIQKAAFARIYSLETVDITESSTNGVAIFNSAFAWNINLTRVTINSNFMTETTIAAKRGAFYHCTSLETVELLGGVMTAMTADLMAATFEDCPSLRTIKVPAGTSPTIFTSLPSTVEIVYV